MAFVALWTGPRQPLERAVSYAGTPRQYKRPGRIGTHRRSRALGRPRQMAKAIGAIALLAEGIPMLFMGEEAGEDRSFLFDMLATDPAFVLRLDDYEQQGSEFLRSSDGSAI